MAESILIDMSNSLLGKVASYACQEAYLAYGLKDNLQSFKDSLIIVRGYLLDAESKKDQSHALREWFKQIQNICFDAEDIFDTFELQDKRKKIVKSSGSIRKKTLFIRDCRMLNLSLDNENSIQKLRMKHLYLYDFPKLLTLPQWIACAVDTLETFVIVNFPKLQMLPEYLSTMALLKRICIARCSQLSTLPSDLHRLTALEYLQILDCPELFRKCQPQFGEYWPMIRDIKNIWIEQDEEEDDEEEDD
ncbi:hypothetical protein KIW84_032524 [Lathyrus oleraceus]|uniref:Disease resistance N-terminal domain-containing protein n=1 Tax=Pisum sativum TaxID=3888 RepID=A0A9D5B2D9_PEA|nr:hypothetical protein KIW84_032524 [Pisum sativum]